MNIKTFLTVAFAAALAWNFHSDRTYADELEASEVERLNPLLTLGGLTTEDYSEGIGDVVIPVYFSKEGLLFLNPRFSFTDRSAEEYNLGLGYRHLISEQQAIIGANVFYDRRETARGASFNQVGFGAEYLSHWVDVRANVYLPVDKEELVNEFSLTEESVSRRSSTSTGVEWDDPFAAGHDIFQDYSLVRSTQTRTTTTTTTRHFREYEVAMRGWDAELGVRLPLEQIEEYAHFKTFAGYYKYFGRRGLDDVDGFRGRLEIHMKPAFVVDAVYYSDDALTGGNYSIGAYVSLPFDLARLANGRNPFSGASERWNAGIQRDSMRYRMVDMVKRDPQIRSLIAEPEEQEELRSTSSRSVTHTQRRTLESGTEEVASDITFVDKNTGNDSNPGTFEDPKETVQGGVYDPRSMVFVFQEGNPYNENVVLTENVILRGEGAPIQVFGGKTFGSGVHPTIDGTGQGPHAIQMAANTSVSGFRINNLTGNGIYSAIGDNLHIADNIIHNTADGVHVDTVGDVNIVLENNEFFNNSFYGAHISGTGASGSYFVNARNNTFDGGIFGMSLEADNYDSAFAVVHGLQASNAIFGLTAQLSADFSTLLSMSDIQANDNFFGVYADIQSDGITALLGGIPRELTGFMGDMIGNGTLPPELEALLSSGGPIQVNDNTFTGMDLNVNGDFLSAMALFDVEANKNGEFGVRADVESSDGAALGFVGSSQNFLETLEFAGSLLGLLGLDMGDLPSTSTGYSLFNDNTVGGLSLNVEGDFLSLAAGMGIQASGNQLSHGVDIHANSPYGAALNILSRIEADNNAEMGINASAHGDFIGLAALLDTHTSNNGVSGVNLDVSGAVAVGLMASTDPIRSLFNIMNDELALDPPIVLPGEPFGPVTASGNDLHGVNASISGDILALGAFLDVHANNNGLFGINANIISNDGDAIGLFASSDQLFDFFLPLLGGPESGHTPMGDMNLSENNGGLLANISGEFGAVGLAAGIEASNNTDLSGPGWGIDFNVMSEDGSALAALFDITANNNALYGIGLDVDADWVASANIFNAETYGNALHGLLINVESDWDDAFLSMAGIQAHNNGLQGILADVSADWDAGVALTDVHASGNMREGLWLEVDAGADALIWMGDTALEDFDDMFGGLGPMGGPFAGIIPSGPSSFNGNGFDPSSPAPRAGARINAAAEDDILLSISDATFNGNSGNGLSADLKSGSGDVDLLISDIQASGNLENGLLFSAESLAGDGNVSAIISDSTFLGNDNFDIIGEVTAYDGDAKIFIIDVILNNYILTAESMGGDADIDIIP